MTTPPAPAASASWADLRENPQWCPLQRSARIRDWECWSWEEPSSPGGPPHDTVLLHLQGERLRIAVVDPVHNRLVDDPHADAWRATSVIHQMLRTVEDASEALDRAAHALHEPGLRPRQRNPLATVAVCDLDLATGRAQVVRCADAEVWVRERPSAPFRPAAAGEMLTALAAARWEELHDPRLRADPRAHFARKEEAVDDPALWRSPAVGLEPSARPHLEALSEACEIIVATDGALLTPGRCETLEPWLREGIQQGVLRSGFASPHGDVALVHLRRI